MRNIRVILLPLVVFASCASGGAVKQAPEWAKTANGVSQVYPNARYIARKGRGTDLISAQNNGAAEISRWFISEIDTSQSSRLSITDETSVFRQTNEETFVNSQTSLFAVRYAPDSWYNKAEKQYETVAYIDRAEAWTIYEPEAQKQAGAFTALFAAAESEKDPLKRFFAYRAADHYTMTSAYRTTMDFGQALSPARMNGAFAEVRTAAATIPQKMEEAKKAANIFVVVDTDNEGALNAALAKALGGAGFPVAKSRAGAAAVCAATVTEGVQKSDMSTFYFPKISITLRSASGGDVFSCSIEAAKQGAINPDIAKLRAYTALAAAIEKQFSVELNEKLIVER